LGLVACAPVLAVAAVAIKLGSPGPVFFRQRRMGRGGRIFELIKLRTMVATAGGPAVTAGDDRRITGVGRLLRQTKIDELPELWHVVRGEMSLVGPRPEVPSLVDLDDPLWRRVLEARPGLTDPVTLRLRNEEALLAGVEGDRDAFYRQVLQPWKLRGYQRHLERRHFLGEIGVLIATVLAIVRPSAMPPPTVAELQASSDEDADRISAQAAQAGRP
jgi:lipopolysaccharide/colanic/teichoic acid biosynthesis glycosyltransferase